MLKSKDSIGLLDKRITFQKKVYSTDASNQRKITGWVNLETNPTVWANVEEKSGQEVFQSDQLVGVTVATITVRFRTDITIEHRVSYDGKYYDIQAILDPGRSRFLKLTCESGGQYK